MNELHDWENSLDQTLASYANRAPRPGMEARILSAAAAQPARWPFRWWPPVGIAVAVCLVVVMLHPAAPHKTGSPEMAANIPAQTPLLAPRAALPAVATVALPAPTHPLTAQSVRKRQMPSANPQFAEKFPTPSALTAEEQRMQQLARNSHVRFLPPQPEIEISTLEISPLPDPQPLDRSQP
jgi:hypothetical protein